MDHSSVNYAMQLVCMWEQKRDHWASCHVRTSAKPAANWQNMHLWIRIQSPARLFKVEAYNYYLIMIVLVLSLCHPQCWLKDETVYVQIILVGDDVRPSISWSERSTLDRSTTRGSHCFLRPRDFRHRGQELPMHVPVACNFTRQDIICGLTSTSLPYEPVAVGPSLWRRNKADRCPIRRSWWYLVQSTLNPSCNEYKNT